MDKTVMYKIEYGLYVLTSRENERDNGCIVNTVMQVTSSPNRVVVAVNKQNYTHDQIVNTKQFNACMLTTETPFQIFEQFGYQSGRDVDKWKGIQEKRASNGLCYLPQYSNGYLSCQVVSMMDLGTHTMFLADVVDGVVLSEEPSVTYSDYHSRIKPAPAASGKKGYRCKICGYIYEGEPLPVDFICPICKHGADDFEKIQ